MNPIWLDKGFLRFAGTQKKSPIQWEEYKLDNGLAITQNNYYSVSAELGVPRSLLASLAGGFNWLSDLKSIPQNEIAFYDIETDDSTKFLFGKILTMRGKDYRFDDPHEMSKMLMHYNAVIGFNNYRFDNEILAKLSPGCFEAIDLPRFTLRVPVGTLCLDALLFYSLWKPWNPDHKMSSLAQEFGMEQPSLDDKEARCTTELQVLQEFFPKMAMIHDWYVENFRIDPLTLFSLPLNGMAKLRRWCYQSYMLQNDVYPQLHKVGTEKKADFYRYFRKGFYRNVHRWDIRACYPTRAANMKLGLYCESDFSEYMKFLVEQRNKNPEISTTIKWQSNAFCGDQGAKTSDLCNANIMADIWLAHKQWMVDKIREVRKSNIIFSYTDNFYSLKDLDFGDTAPYELKREQDFIWLAIYNQQRLLGLQADGTFFRKHFDREMRQLAMWKKIDNWIDIMLKTEPEKFIKNPMEFWPKMGMDDFPLDDLKLTIYKNSETCNDFNYYLIWDKLKMGFNEVWLGKVDKILTEPNLNKIAFAKYKGMVKKYLSLYKLGGKE